MAERSLLCIVLLLKSSKASDFTTEHFIYCDLKPAKCRFYDGAHYTSQHIVNKSQQNVDITKEHINITLHHILIKKQQNADFMTEYKIYNASYRYR